MIMQKLALDDELLLGIQQPARYIGGEINSVKKDPDSVAKVALALAAKKNPPARVPVGIDYKALMVLLRFLPDRVKSVSFA